MTSASDVITIMHNNYNHAGSNWLLVPQVSAYHIIMSWGGIRRSNHVRILGGHRLKGHSIKMRILDRLKGGVCEDSNWITVCEIWSLQFQMFIVILKTLKNYILRLKLITGVPPSIIKSDFNYPLVYLYFWSFISTVRLREGGREEERGGGGGEKSGATRFWTIFLILIFGREFRQKISFDTTKYLL